MTTCFAVEMTFLGKNTQNIVLIFKHRYDFPTYFFKEKNILSILENVCMFDFSNAQPDTSLNRFCY